MAGYNLLLEDGSAILLESGSNLLLESSPSSTGTPGRMTITQLAPTATVTRAGLGTATVSRGGGTMTTTRTT